ncbi:hypothetical protein TanjilG_11635 [Lupinus angustifolius]|uniref:Uncharacterized protein n=1 Tax=Lupinus angustifolius TaxID=3871 RepID=A0A1J7I419_LUPAN|nr:hypothetical protein TanjilG_11635 [Lupinus angustifolius]
MPRRLLLPMVWWLKDTGGARWLRGTREGGLGHRSKPVLVGGVDDESSESSDSWLSVKDGAFPAWFDEGWCFPSLLSQLAFPACNAIGVSKEDGDSKAVFKEEGVSVPNVINEDVTVGGIVNELFSLNGGGPLAPMDHLLHSGGVPGIDKNFLVSSLPNHAQSTSAICTIGVAHGEFQADNAHVSAQESLLDVQSCSIDVPVNDGPVRLSKGLASGFVKDKKLKLSKKDKKKTISY